MTLVPTAIELSPLSAASRYARLVAEVSRLLDTARRTSARAVNTVMTATYWELGRRIVEFDQAGEKRAAYGEQLLERLATDLTARFGLAREYRLALPDEKRLAEEIEKTRERLEARRESR